MLEYEKQRKLILIFIMAVIIVIVISIAALILIWTPEEEKPKEFAVGEIETNTVTEQNIILKYYDEISELLLLEDIETIYNMLSEDYLAYNKYDKEDIKDYLVSKGILGRNLELVTTSTYSIPEYSNVYYLDIKAVNEVYSLGVVIKETSPEDYTISFDKFIDCSTESYKTAVNSIELNIYETVRFTNSVMYKFMLTNNYDKEVYINDNSLANAVLLVSSAGIVKQPIVNTLSISQIKLQPQQSRPFSAVYNINDEYDYLTYNTLVFKDIRYEGIQGVTDIQFIINN